MEDDTLSSNNIHNVEVREDVFSAFLNSNSLQNYGEFGKYLKLFKNM